MKLFGIIINQVILLEFLKTMGKLVDILIMLEHYLILKNQALLLHLFMQNYQMQITTQMQFLQ